MSVEQKPSRFWNHVYVHHLAVALGSFLAAAAIVGLADAVVAINATDAVEPFEIVLVSIALYAVPALVIAFGFGLFAGAWRSSFGPRSIQRWWQRLREDRAFDANTVAGLLAIAVASAAFIVIVRTMAIPLVATPQRKAIGALLLAAMALIVALPIAAAIGLVCFRACRVVSAYVPRLRRIPNTAVLVVLGIVIATLFLYQQITTKLDYRALNFTPYFTLLGFLACGFVFYGIWQHFLAHRSALVSVRRLGVVAGSVLALLMVAVVLPVAPETTTVYALTEEGPGTTALVRWGRSLVDRDGDDYSPFLGGPDCDDTNASVYAGAKEIPGNAIDEDCDGEDAVPVAPATEKQVSEASRSLRFEGNLLFIVVDTLRADRLGVTGYRRDDKSLTPNLDTLARSAIHFKRTYAQASRTPGSVPSLLASRFPAQLKVSNPKVNYPVILDENLLLPEILSQRGIRTLWFSSHYYFRDKRGYGQGFAQGDYDNSEWKPLPAANKDVAAPRIVAKTLAAITKAAQNKTRFAAFVHLFEPHSSYVAHKEFPITIHRGKESLKQKYDYEIAFTDIQIGKLLEGLHRLGLADNTMVVLVSDHGEGFASHRLGGQAMFFHGRTLYEEEIRVPWLLKIPGVKARELSAPVMLVDVAPTILDIFGIPQPPQFVGRSLVPSVLGREQAAHPAFAHLMPYKMWNKHPLRMIVSGDGQFKLLHRYAENFWELYDLVKDPQERRNLFKEKPDIAGKLQRQLKAWKNTAL